MRKRTPLGLLALALVPGAAQADAAAPPLPAIVQKYVQAVHNLRAVTVDAVQTQPAKPADTAHVILQAPNKLWLVSKAGGKTVTVVSDGKTVAQWDAKKSHRQPAPASLDKIEIVLPAGAAAEIAESLLTDPTNITDYANLQDTGRVTLNGQPAEKVVSLEDGDTATFWLSPATGLPLQAAYTGGRKDRTIALRYAPTHIAAGTFQARVPAGRVAYTPPQGPQLLAVGTPAPDFTLPHAGPQGIQTHTLTLSSLRGRVVLLDFWASWCRPCKKTMPHIQALNRELADKGVTFLSIDTWDQQPRMAAFLKAHPWYTTTMLCDPSPADKSVAVRQYNVSGIPTVYIIDRAGNVAGAFIGDDPDAAKSIETTLARLDDSPGPAVAPTAAVPVTMGALPVGTPAPDFTLSTADNDKPIALSDFAGHPVLLTFWSAATPTSQKTLPQMQALSSEFARQGLTVLAMDAGDTRNGMKTFLQAHPEYTLTVLADSPDARHLYRVTTLPTSYLIAKDGKIAASFVGAQDSADKKLRAALAAVGIVGLAPPR